MKICQASWCHGQDSHQALSSEPIPAVYLYNLSISVTRTSALFISQSTSVCPYPSSYHNSPPVHILHASKCHHTHSSIYLHSPSSSTVHLCWCKCSVKSQMIGHILQWRMNVTTFLMAVLSILKCLYKIGQSSSYHPATICVSVLCPVPSLRSVTYKDSRNIPSYFQMTLHGIYSCQHHCDNVVWTDTRLAQMLHIFVLLLIPSRNFSFIRIAALPIHYAVCQPLQLSPHQEVHPQGVIKLPLEQTSNIELLCLPWDRVPWFWFLEWSWPIHITLRSTSCVAGSWSNASDAPTLSRNAPCTVIMSNCILCACKSHHKQMFQLM